MQFIKTYKLFETEDRTEAKKKYACVMVYFDMPLFKAIQTAIDDADLTKDGKEVNPHVTIFYGLHDEVDPETTLDLLSGIDAGSIVLGPVSVFENDEVDVLKFEASAPWLYEANASLSSLPNSNEYPEYQPHCTLAYVKAGTGKKYVDMFKGIRYDVIPNKFAYSLADKTKITRPIDAN